MFWLFCADPQEVLQPKITECWLGYKDDGYVSPVPLSEVSRDSSRVAICFIYPTEDSWHFDDTFEYTKEEIRQGVDAIHVRGTGQKVFFVAMDRDHKFWDPYVDILKFAESIGQAVREWDLGGIIIDAETGMDPENPTRYVQKFVELISSVKAAMPEDRELGYIAYECSDQDRQILEQTREQIDFVLTDSYVSDFYAQKQAMEQYADWYGKPRQTGMGIRAAQDYTDLETTKKCAQFQHAHNLPEMLYWHTARDRKKYSGEEDGTWMRTIVQNLKGDA